MINRIPVYPSIGNHDAAGTEDRDDRAQVETTSTSASGWPATRRPDAPRSSPGLFYRFRYGADIEFICLDTSKEAFFSRHRLFEFPKHWAFLEASFPAAGGAIRCGGFRSATTRRSAPARGITTPTTCARCCRCSQRAGVSVDVQRPRAQLPALARRRHRLLRVRAPAASCASARRTGSTRRTPSRGATATSCS